MATHPSAMTDQTWLDSGEPCRLPSINQPLLINPHNNNVLGFGRVVIGRITLATVATTSVPCMLLI